MNSDTIKKLTADYIMPTYGRYDVCLTSGNGCAALDPEGNRYLDFGSGIGVNCLGFADAGWTKAVANQAATLQHTSNLYYTAPGALLAKALCEKSGMDKVFFANSGTEANEGAIKAARKYSHDKYGEGRHTVVTLTGSFHGRSMGSLSATGQEALHQHFHPFLPGFVHVAPNNLATLKQALDGTVCAVMFEPIQGEGGVNPLDSAYLAEMRALCDAQDVLMIADEVQCGVGRTGAFLGSAKLGVLPDIATLAKGLGGGLPIGAVLFSKKSALSLEKGNHGATYGANPVCCAAALAVMERITDELMDDVNAKGAHMRQKLAALPGITGVSGSGLMLGASLAPPLVAAEVVAAGIKKGILVLTAKERLRFLPPLTISMDEIDEGMLILKTVLEELQ